jgi:F420-dependent oxidoreductase-like protein
MDLRIFVEPQQGASYERQLAVAQVAEEQGFDAFFRSDHLLAIGGQPMENEGGLPGPTDSWVTLGAIARETSTIRLGTMVTSVTFRQPGMLAMTVAQVDEMSNGRVELGLGTGWYGDEHLAYGIPFGTTGERFEKLEEQLEIITGMWRCPIDSQYSFEGQHYTVVGSPALPKPAQAGGPPVIIGGWGAKRTPRLAATYAAEYNVPFSPVAAFREQCDRVREACTKAGRDPESMIFSVAQVICCGEDDGEVSRRAEVIGRSVEDLRENAIAGTPAQVLDTLAAFAEAGAERVYLQTLDMTDLDHVRLVGEQVLPVLP